MSWQEVVIKTNRETEEMVSDLLLDCGANGVVVEDPYLIKERIEANLWDAFEFPDELLDRDYILVKVYLAVDSNYRSRLEMIRDRLHLLAGEQGRAAAELLAIREVKEEDWAESWKVYYKPVKIGEKIVIKPQWEDYRAVNGEVVVELDPGVAFGTGTHPTTMMCVRLLEKVIQGGETVFDIGTGSGILSIVAAKLGAVSVKAVDLDEMAVKAAAANVRLNGLDERIQAMSGNLLDHVAGRAEVVVANIVADVIIRVCPKAAAAMLPGGRLIASGIILSRQEEVLAHIRQAGLTVDEILEDGGWIAVLAGKEG